VGDGGVRKGGRIMANDVVYASQDVSLHRSFGVVDVNGREVEEVSGFVLPAGESVALEELASYQQEAIKQGNLAGLEVVSQDEAEKRKAQRAEVAQAASGVMATAPAQFTFGPDSTGPDTTVSDHAVSEMERLAEHAARAEEEAGSVEGEQEEDVSSEPLVPEGHEGFLDDGRKTNEADTMDEAVDKAGGDSGKSSGSKKK
jgi:hypothetical protein